MPYTAQTTAVFGVVAAADTDVVDALKASEQRAAEIGAEMKKADVGFVSLRRAHSESTVQQVQTTKPVVPTVALPTHIENSPLTQTPISMQDDSNALLSPRPRLQRSTHQSPRLPSPSGMNVLPAVRSPRKGDVEPSLQTRRSRRPRLFGFTEVSSAQSSACSSAEQPSSPVQGPSAGPSMLPRRNPVRARSETSLTLLPRAQAPPKPAPSMRERRNSNGLKLDLGGIVPVPLHEAIVNAGIVKSPYHSVLKKKSGEIVKPALKYNGPLLPNGTPIDRAQAYAGSRSCPTTPSFPKYVHFDAQLERVKLFLQDQKPQVVSRQGSPTDDMSENEADGEDEAEKILTIKLPNFPSAPEVDSELFLESLHLNEQRDALRGVLCCKNLAFEKWVAVRFTFDWWQTTSEVTATHKESIRGGSYDRFSFTLKLNDLLERLEEKTLFLCVRYNTAGREIWDSNEGQNYKVLFEKKAPEQPKITAKRGSTVPPGLGRSVKSSGSPWSVTGADADRMADLRAKLNRLTAEDQELDRPLSPARRASPRTARVQLPGSPKPSAAEAPDLPRMKKLSGRYDFGSALRKSPQTQKREVGSEFYSPRLGHFQLPSVGISPLPVSPLAGPPSPGMPSPGLPESPTSPLPPHVSSPQPPPLTFASLNSSSSTSLDSVTATPADSPALPRRRDLREVSEESTSSDATDSVEGSETSTASSPMSPTDVLPWSPYDKDGRSADMSPGDYSSFIEQFCWGGVAGPDLAVPGAVRRVHSTSSLEHYFSSPPDALTPRAFTPTHGLSRSASGTGTSSATTPNALRARASPPTRADLEHVDNAIRSLSNSLSNTPISGSPNVSPPLSRIPSGMGTVLAA